ncbi:hypothetical protein SBRCBS47491_000857 [Sporothrix bragantina]|uniref:Glycosyl transferase CAP10 domain-containing protein n=1 Tax=Sporothrix bragantina TaxID=671064 RepID=A0ABP0ATX3_9PEZI
MDRLTMLRQRPCRQLSVIATAGILLLIVYHVYHQPVLGQLSVHRLPLPKTASLSNRKHFDDLRLDDAQCQATFPGLTKDIDDMVAFGSFSVKYETRPDSPMLVRLEKGQLYIVHHETDKDIITAPYRDARLATLHQIHRAILTSPVPLPDTVLAVNVLDGPRNDTLSYSRAAFGAATPGSPLVTRAFLMPHFSFWGWPALPFVGSFQKAVEAVSTQHMPFSKKDARPVWRGTKRYNSAQHPKMREDLLAVAGGQRWADVQELAWGEGDGQTKNDQKVVATNALRIQDFCKYKYVVHTEGITYSGRLQFLQLCASVLLTPPMAWLQHTTHLVKPVYASDLLGVRTTEKETTSPAGKKWPRYSPSEANAVFVAPDWSDLYDAVTWLEAHLDVAEGIAQRQRSLFWEQQGYLSPAAEVCYWRALIQGWAKVAKVIDERWSKAPRGVPWEEFAMGYPKEVRDK